MADKTIKNEQKTQTFEWEHIFPNGRNLTVVVTVDLDKDEVVGARYATGRLLDRSDFEDLVDSLTQNADGAGPSGYGGTFKDLIQQHVEDRP